MSTACCSTVPPGTADLLHALPPAQWAIVTSGILATQAGNFAAAGKAAGMTVLAVASTHRTVDLTAADRSAPFPSVAADDILRWMASGW